MRDIAEIGLDAARSGGASYADVRIVSDQQQDVQTRNGALASLRASESLGAGVRVLVDGAWGFAAGTDLTRDGIAATARRAVEIGRASAILKIRPVELCPVEALEATWEAPVKEDPFAVSVEEKIATLLHIDAALRKVPDIKVAVASMTFGRQTRRFASTEGHWLVQTRTTSGAGYAATAVGAGDAQTRSFPNAFGGQHMAMGYELIRSLPLLEQAQRVAEEARELLAAAPCPSGTWDIILDSSQLALQVHESCGHPAELDRVLGSEANYAGKSFLTLDKLGRFVYGSEHVNITADSTTPAGLGTWGYDDEGVPASSVDLVRRGLFVGYLTSRETAATVGATRSSGAMRADGWNRIPLIRMNNVSLEPGEGSLEELIASTGRGVYMETNRSWSIDNLRYNFQFGCEAGWEIKDGKRGRMLKNPIYTGITPTFWGSCDAVCGAEAWRLWGLPNCGKGHPGQIMGTSHGAAPARFRGVQLLGAP